MVIPYTLRCGLFQGPSSPVVPAGSNKEAGNGNRHLWADHPALGTQVYKEGRHVSGTWHVLGAVSKRGFGSDAREPGGSEVCFHVGILSVPCCR